MRVCFGLAAALVLALAGMAQAGQVDFKQVSADAKWAAHLDVDALMASEMLKKSQDQIFKNHPHMEAQLTVLRNLWRFDPMTDLHGITIYGTQLKKDTGVAIIQAKVDQKLLLDLVKTTPEHQVSTYGKYEIHAWKDGRKQQNATFFKPDVVVFGATAEELKAALDVLDGTKPSIKLDAAHLPPGLIFCAGGRDLSEANLHPESPLSKQVDSALLLVGENQGEVFMQMTLNVKDAEIAKHIKTAAEGALSFATLAKIDDPDALKLIGAMKVTLQDKSITVKGQAPVDLLRAHLQKAIEKHKGDRAEHVEKMKQRIHDTLTNKS